MHDVKVTDLFAKFSRPIILVLLFLFFSLATKTFWSIGDWSNISNIILQQAPFTVLLTICMMFSVILKGFDISIGSAVALISCVMGYILQGTGNTLLAIAAAVLLGMLIGLTNGLLIAKVKVPPFIATFSMQMILQGIALLLLGGREIYSLGPTFRKTFISNKFTFFVISAAVCAVLAFVLGKTVFGRGIYATGINGEAARLCGINTGAVNILTYLISGVVIAIVSVMYLANLGTAEPTIGADFPMTAIAAALIGGVPIAGGSGRISQAVIGTLIMLFLTNGMVQIGVPSVWQKVVIGAVIVIAVLIERGLQRISDRGELKRSVACRCGEEKGAQAGPGT